MNRKKALDYIEYMFPSDDMIIYIGETLCGEVHNTDREFAILMDKDYLDYFSLALGIAMTTEKRIILVCEDYYVLKYFKSVVQISVSQCKNIVILVLVTGEYAAAGGQPTIFNSIRSPKGVFFNMGLLTHDYTNYFKNKGTLKSIIDMLTRFNCPVVGLIRVENKKLYVNDIPKVGLADLTSKLREYNATHNSTEQS